jgi:hypothetical protein
MRVTFSECGPTEFAAVKRTIEQGGYLGCEMVGPEGKLFGYVSDHLMVAGVVYSNDVNYYSSDELEGWIEVFELIK